MEAERSSFHPAAPEARKNPIRMVITNDFGKRFAFSKNGVGVRGSVAEITTGHNRAVAAAVQAAVWNSPAMKVA
jgi:hypothetical protein